MIKVKSNRHWRPYLTGSDLPDSQRDEFDWMSDRQFFEEEAFIKYKGRFFAISELILGPLEIRKQWRYIHNDNFFSGIVVNLGDDEYQVGLATC